MFLQFRSLMDGTFVFITQPWVMLKPFVPKTKGASIFQIYLTSILYTYKVSRKLQNIYYYQEGIIMLRSNDKTICRTQKHRRASFLSLAPTLFTVMDTKKISHICTKKKLRYNFVQSTFLQKTSLHTKPKCVYDNYMWAMWKITLKPPSENGHKTKKVPVPTLWQNYK